MADPILFEPTPVEILLQTSENEVSNSHSVWQDIEFSNRGTLAENSGNVGKLAEFDGQINSGENGILSNLTRNFEPSNFGDLWREHGLEEPVAGCQINTLGQHEMLVQGSNVDERILPGFSYRVRILSQKRRDRFQFDGKALRLLRIGQGYGKRLTFESEIANINANFFWSDTHPNGYAFSISTVQPGDEFVVQCRQHRRPFGRATVIATNPHQVEIESVIDGKDVVKKVLVAMRVRVHHGMGGTAAAEPSGVKRLRAGADETIDVSGVAIVTRGAGKSTSITNCIEEVEIDGHGECILYREED